MATFRSEDDGAKGARVTGARVETTGGATVALPGDATPEEAAAIAVAVGTHLREQRAAAAAAAEEGDGEADWRDRRWRFAGRLEGLGEEGKRVPEGAPTDMWTAAGRTDRF